MTYYKSLIETRILMKICFVWQKFYNKQYRKAWVTGVSHEWCSQHKGLEKTVQLLIPMSLPACLHQRCWWASQERESLCVNEKQAHFVRWCRVDRGLGGVQQGEHRLHQPWHHLLHHHSWSSGAALRAMEGLFLSPSTMQLGAAF